MSETIIQFGEGNFLRAFADDFIDTMNKSSAYGGKAVIVKPTPRGSLDDFYKSGCVYNLVLRGIENGKEISKIKEVHSVSRCVNPYKNFESYLSLARIKSMRIIISNTTEAGIVYDENCRFEDRPALSFPAKLTQLLFERYKTGLDGFIILPCELIENNAGKLKLCVLRHAKDWNLGSGFNDWVNKNNSFCNTLVDRIVSGYPKSGAEEIFKETGHDDPLLDIAEPYHFFAIEGDFEDELPLKKAGINAVWTDDVAPLRKRKVRLLNGSHTAIVFPALLLGLETVEDCTEDGDIKEFLNACLFNTALKTLKKNAENMEFAHCVIERFKNPYLNHRLKAISLNSVSKFNERIAPAAEDFYKTYGNFPKTASFSLASLIYYYKYETPCDCKDETDFIKNNSVEEILESNIFKPVFKIAKNDILRSYEYILGGRIREGLKWAIS